MTFSSNLLLMLMTLVGVSVAEAELAGDDRAPNPSGVQVTISTDKSEYFLGENVILHWRIQNTGESPFTVDMGGDGRTPGAKRAIRFKVEASNAASANALDPYPNPHNFGGFGGGRELLPGEEYLEDLQLMRYREIVSPGEYTILVYHDLGWERLEAGESFARRTISDIPDGPLAAPIATTKIRFNLPTEDQAREVVASVLELPDEAIPVFGKSGRLFADYELLRYPVYLPIVLEMAQQGDLRGLDAIGAMAFPEATAALLQLIEQAEAKTAANACDLLLGRIPSECDQPPSRRDYLVTRSWTNALKTRALSDGWNLLSTDDRENVIRGGRVVQAFGGKNDLARLIDVMDRALVAMKSDDVEQRSYLRPRTASDSLASAALQLLKRGALPPRSANSPGRAVAWLLALHADESFRPEGWQETARTQIEHPIPYIRFVACRNLPLPLDNATIKAVAKAFEDDYPPVQGATCELAAHAQDEAFSRPIVDVLKNADNDWVVRSAFRAAAKCGVENDRRLEICLNRMRPRDNNWNMLMLNLLIDGAISHNGHSAQAIDDWTTILPHMGPAWRNFIDENRQALREGAPLDRELSSVTPEMFPPGFKLD